MPASGYDDPALIALRLIFQKLLARLVEAGVLEGDDLLDIKRFSLAVTGDLRTFPDIAPSVSGAKVAHEIRSFFHALAVDTD